MDTTHPAQSARKPRSARVRNHDRVLEAARAVFAAGGPDGRLEAVARQAGVGIGTLYRHFPTRQALFEAVYRREVDQLVELAQEPPAQESALDALRRWMHANVAFVATKQGMSAALAVAVHTSSDLSTSSLTRLRDAADVIVRRGINAGSIRSDIDADDILRTIFGLCYMHDQPGWQSNVHRLVDVFADGLRRN